MNYVFVATKHGERSYHKDDGYLMWFIEKPESIRIHNLDSGKTIDYPMHQINYAIPAPEEYAGELKVKNIIK